MNYWNYGSTIYVHIGVHFYWIQLKQFTRSREIDRFVTLIYQRYINDTDGGVLDYSIVVHYYVYYLELQNNVKFEIVFQIDILVVIITYFRKTTKEQQYHLAFNIY